MTLPAAEGWHVATANRSQITRLPVLSSVPSLKALPRHSEGLNQQTWCYYVSLLSQVRSFKTPMVLRPAVKITCPKVIKWMMRSYVTKSIYEPATCSLSFCWHFCCKKKDSGRKYSWTPMVSHGHPFDWNLLAFRHAKTSKTILHSCMAKHKHSPKWMHMIPNVSWCCELNGARLVWMNLKRRFTPPQSNSLMTPLPRQDLKFAVVGQFIDRWASP